MVGEAVGGGGAPAAGVQLAMSGGAGGSQVGCWGCGIPEQGSRREVCTRLTRRLSGSDPSGYSPECGRGPEGE